MTYAGSPSDDEALDHILGERAADLKMSVDDLKRRIQARASTPRFLAAAKRLADKENLDVQSVLQEDINRLLESKYPGSNCLSPTQVEQYINFATTENFELSHLDECSYCKNLVEMARPQKAQIEEFLEEVRLQLPTVIARVVLESSKETSADQEKVSDDIDRAVRLFKEIGFESKQARKAETA